MPQNAYDIAPWLGEHEAPMVALARGVQAGSQLTTNFLQGMRARQEKEDFEMMAPLKYQQAEQQVKQGALQIATQQNMLQLQTQTRAGQALFSEALAKIAREGSWAKPESIAEIARIGAANPSIVGSAPWMGYMDSVEKSQAMTLKAAELQRQVEYRDEQLKLTKDRLDFNKEKDTDPTALKLVNEIEKEDALASAAKASGDTASYARHQKRSDLLNQSLPGTSESSIVTGYDDQGRPIVTVGKGGKGGSSPGGGATVGTASIAQQKLVKYDNATQLLAGLERTLKPSDVGAAGVGGEFLLDRTLAQVPGFEGAASTGRIANRTALGVVKESLMKEISDDSRFSNRDREDIGKMLPSTGVFESYPDAMQRIKTVRQIIADRSRNYSERIGEPVPMFAQTTDELRDNYIRRTEALNKAVANGNLSKEDADKQIADLYEKTTDALVKFH